MSYRNETPQQILLTCKLTSATVRAGYANTSLQNLTQLKMQVYCKCVVSFSLSLFFFLKFYLVIYIEFEVFSVSYLLFSHFGNIRGFDVSTFFIIVVLQWLFADNYIWKRKNVSNRNKYSNVGFNVAGLVVVLSIFLVHKYSFRYHNDVW